VKLAHSGWQHDVTSEGFTQTPESDMPNTDQIPARPPVFGCTATHGGLDAAWVNVACELDIATAPEPVPPPTHALQRSLVSQSLLRTDGTARHRVRSL
jgi:hypothetical protein